MASGTPAGPATVRQRRLTATISNLRPMQSIGGPEQLFLGISHIFDTKTKTNLFQRVMVACKNLNVLVMAEESVYVLCLR
jgi:hypothetical protein